MKKKKVYSSDLKLQLVKEYLNSEKSLKEFSDEYSIPINTLSQWVQKYKKSNYDDSVFNTKKGRTKSMISDYSKIPPIIYESAGISRPDDSINSNDSVYLKKKLNYYEKILLEKELQLRILQDEVELLKKNMNHK